MLRATTSIDNFSALSYQGTWNASTNTPTLTSSVGTAGYYYIVSVAGSTSLNGISTWNVGDWVIFSNTGVWQRIAGGLTGSVNIANDTSGNVNYNLVLTNANSGTVSTFDVDSPNLSFNPSTGILSSQIIECKVPSGGSLGNFPQIRIRDSNAGAIAFYDENNPDLGIYNYTIFMDEGYIYFGMSTTNTPYDYGNTIMSWNQYGGIALGVTSGLTNGNFGTTGQILTSGGSSAAAYWSSTIKTPATTYSGLGSAATAGAGARGFITDSTTTTFLATAAGGGSNAVPVVSNGTNWLVG
jgi:hypothetical protein